MKVWISITQQTTGGEYTIWVQYWLDITSGQIHQATAGDIL